MNERLNTQDLVDLLAKKHGMPKKDADGFVKEFFLLIEQALDSDKCVKIKGLGTFKLVEVDTRESVNVHTGERFQMQGHTKVSFTPDTALRDVINKPFAHFETVVLNENTVLGDTLVEEQEDESAETAELIDNQDSEPIVDKEPETDEALLESPIPEVTDHATPPVCTEDIIANELRKAERAFGTVKIETGKTVTHAESFSAQKTVLHKQKEGKTALPYLVAIIVFVLLLCGSALLFVYYPDLLSFGHQKEVAQRADPQVGVQQKVFLDTLIVAKDTVAEVVPEVKEALPEKQQKEPSAPANVENKTSAKAAIPIKPDSVNYKISGTKTTYTLKEGETLTRVSLRFYGTKDLWPYIVQHNRDIIKNPDNVPYGTTLRIPELVKR